MDIMVDLETTGNSPGCGIFAIGAVAFSPEEGWVGHPFFSLITQESLDAAGLKKNPGTMQFWAEQSPEARAYLEASQANQGESLSEAMDRYGAYLANWDDSKPWGNGSDFDNAILRSAYDALGQSPSWKYRNSRCHRTMAAEHPDITVDEVGTYHHALDDAVYQATLLIHVLRRVRNLPPLDRPIEFRGMEDSVWEKDPLKTQAARKAQPRLR